MRSPMMKASIIYLAIVLELIFLTGCQNEDKKVDVCLDRALARCTPIGIEKCGLSHSSSDAEFDACPAYKACEDAAFMQCMNN